ncbi:MAG: winged helix-turn-helix transcriptional regulator [Chloroflexi bacterium]|nr:winged helix-turn-helix transcriptional regulator [Chloroflexota bacterium]
MASRMRPTDCCSPTTPSDLAPSRRDQLVAVYRALGDATRLEVFRLIAAQPGPICVCDIVDRFNVSQPTISHHLKALRDAGLVKVSRRGVWAFYAVDPAGLAILKKAPADLVPPELMPTELADVS